MHKIGRNFWTCCLIASINSLCTWQRRPSDTLSRSALFASCVPFLIACFCFWTAHVNAHAQTWKVSCGGVNLELFFMAIMCMHTYPHVFVSTNMCICIAISMRYPHILLQQAAACPPGPNPVAFNVSPNRWMSVKYLWASKCCLNAYYNKWNVNFMRKMQTASDQGAGAKTGARMRRCFGSTAAIIGFAVWMILCMCVCVCGWLFACDMLPCSYPAGAYGHLPVHLGAASFCGRACRHYSPAFGFCTISLWIFMHVPKHCTCFHVFHFSVQIQ